MSDPLRSNLRVSTAMSCAIVAAILGASPASAACNQSSNIVDCAGNTNGPVTIQQDNTTVTIAAGAIVDSGAAGSGLLVFGDDNSVTNNGLVETATDGAFAIRAVANSGQLLITNNGEVRSSGNGFTQGILAQGVTANVAVVNNAAGTVTGNNVGITVATSNGLASATNHGTITIGTNAQFTGSSAGIAGFAGVTGSSSGLNEILLHNTGTIDADRATADGMFGYIRSGQQAFRNDGTITGLNGIVGFYENGDTTIINAGSIDAGGNAIRTADRGSLAGDASRISIQNSGSIVAGDRGILAGLVQSQTASIANLGTIEAQRDAISLFGATADNIVAMENSGQIVSRGETALRVTLSGGTFTLNNSGLIESQGTGINDRALSISNSVDNIINSGEIVGDVALGALDDIFQITGGSILGNLNGGAEIDRLAFDAPAEFIFAHDIVNFETISIGGPVVFEGVSISGADSFTIQSGAQLKIRASDSNIQSALSIIDGSLAIDPGLALSVDGDFSASAGSTIVLGLGSDLAQINVTGDAHFAAGSQIEIDARDENLLIHNASFDAVVAGGTLTDDSGAIVDNSMLFDFTKSVVGGNRLLITTQQILRLPDAVTPGDANASQVAGALQDIIDNGTGQAATLATALGQIADAGTLANAIDSFGPGESNAVLLSVIEHSSVPFGVIRDRTDAVRGMGAAIWGNASLSDGRLSRDGDLSGFDSDVSAVSAGFDFWLGKSGATRAGFGYGYTDGQVQENGNRQLTAQQQSHSLFAYIFEQNDAVRYSASLGHSWTTVDSSRGIETLAETAGAQYDVRNWFGRFEIGRGFEAKERLLMPYAGVQVVDVSIDEYQESGSIGALRVASRSATSVRADLGLKAHLGNRKAGLSFVGRAAATYELGDLDPLIDARFETGGPSFITQVSDRNSLGAMGEAKLQWAAGESFSLQLGYEGRIAGDYQVHTARLTASMQL